MRKPIFPFWNNGLSPFCTGRNELYLGVRDLIGSQISLPRNYISPVRMKTGIMRQLRNIVGLSSHNRFPPHTLAGVAKERRRAIMLQLQICF